MLGFVVACCRGWSKAPRHEKALRGGLLREDYALMCMRAIKRVFRSGKLKPISLSAQYLFQGGRVILLVSLCALTFGRA